MIDFSFPTTAAEFIAYQERLIHRPLSDGEKEVLAVVVDALNEEYIAGLEGDDPFPRDELPRIFNKDDLQQFAGALIQWCSLAYNQGRKDAGKGVAE